MPSAFLHVHMVAIGGTGMAPLACLLREAGHRVTGSDLPLYPPMSTLLAEAGIQPLQGFDARHLDPRPDLVVVGNAVPRSNPEAVEAERLGLPRCSMPEALGRFFLDGHKPLVVAGTHGKTTTSALAAWVYDRCGRDPGFLVGGVPLDLGASFRRGSGERFVVEGDEYNAAYFDRGPKFLHYRPETAILTSVEHDHADLYPRAEDLVEAFGRLLDLLPVGGLLAAAGDSPAVRAVTVRARCPVVFYGLGDDNDVRPVGPVEASPDGQRLRVAGGDLGEAEVRLALHGPHNVANALAVWTVARRDGLPAAGVAAALSTFRGVKRRMEIVGEAGGVIVVDDFAHHPTAVEATLRGLRQRFPGRRLLALFEPRSLTAGRAFFFEAYLRAFREADGVLFAPVFHAGRLSDEERLDLPRLARELSARGTAAETCEGLEGLLARARERLAAGDVAVTMSSGSFDGAAGRLLEALGPAP